MYATMIVNITSTIAILNIRYEWGPCPGTPNIFLYLHKFIYIVKELNKKITIEN